MIPSIQRLLWVKLNKIHVKIQKPKNFSRRKVMSKNNVRKLALIAVIVVLAVSAVMVYGGATGGQNAYDIPRMLGMAGEEGEVARLQGPPTTDINGPFFETQAAAVSMDRDLRDLPQTGPESKRPMREMGQLPTIDRNAAPDPVIQTHDTVGGRPVGPLAVAPAPLISFKGLDFAGWGGGWPPDTHGDVGPTHYIQVVNTSIGIFNKATGTRLAAFTFNTFFAGASGTCASGNSGDPVALYDQVSGRWIITDFAWANIQNGPYYECIAVSKTADPISGGWWLYTFRADDDSHAWLNDYPKLGLWQDGIYMSSNLFDCLTATCSSANYSGVRVWALNRDDMISGAALRSVSFITGTSYYSLLPANVKGALPPANTPEYFMSSYGSNTSMKLWKFTANWTTPASSTFTGPTSFAVASYNEPSGSVPQLDNTTGAPDALDTLGDRLMTWLQYRNIGGTESLWVSRTVVAGTSTGIRWMEVRNMSTTPSVYQQGTYAPDSLYRWMPSLAVNKSGDMAIGYSVSSSSMFPAIRYAGRLAGDALNTLGQTENILIAGTGSQYNGYSRWGDYSSMSVDPVDDCTFWYTTEYYEASGYNWQTRIGSFRLSSCGPVDNAPTATVDTPASGATVAGTVNVTATANDDFGVTQVEFFVDGSSIGVDSNGGDGWSATWNTTTTNDGAHNVTATATDTNNQTGSDTNSVTVQNTPVPTLHIGDLDGSSVIYRRLYWRATVTITVHDGNHVPVQGVTLYLTWSGGYKRNVACTTNSLGQCTLTTPNMKTSFMSVTLTVTNAVKLTFVYNPSANHDPDGDSTGTVIIVTR
jgi:hypothetical protein